MPKYIAKRPTWLSHECRMVKEGEEFSTTFPPAKDAKGKPVGDMILGDNLELVAEDKPADTGKKPKEPKDPKDPLA